MSTLGNTNVFAGTLIPAGDGAIYVPTALVDTYKVNGSWSQFFITSIDNYPLTDFSTIPDSWSQIIAAAEDGTASSKYSVGDTKLLDLGTEGQVYMQIVGFNKDVLSSDTSKTAGITFMSMQVLKSYCRMNSTNTTVGGWADSGARSYLSSSIMPLIPSEVANAIKQVNKTYYDYVDSATEIASDKLWLPSARELGFSGNQREDSGCTYDEWALLPDRQRRYKQSLGTTVKWQTRSAYSDTKFRTVSNTGSPTSDNANSSTINTILCFCI